VIISAPTAPVPHWMTWYRDFGGVTPRHATADSITIRPTPKSRSI